jgi:PAS domain S-box-containing protein
MNARNRMNNSGSGESAKQALPESESHFRALVDGVRDYAIFLLDSEGNVASWNQGAERIKGYKADEIIGKHFSVFYTPESIEKRWPEDELDAAQKEGRAEDENWRVRKDGSRFWANVTITALRDENGSLVGFLKITRDLTSRRQAEEQRARLIREQAARAEAETAERNASFLAEASQALASSLEEERIHQSVTRAVVPFLADICIIDRLEDGFARLAAVKQSSTVPSDARSLLSNYYPLKLDDNYLISEVLRTGQTRVFGDLSKLSKSARKFYGQKSNFALLEALCVHSAIVVPLLNRSEVSGTITFALTDSSRAYDLAEITLAEDLGRRLTIAVDHALLYASAQAAQRKAEAASRAKDRFLAMLSHELRTPLMPVLFSSSFLIEDPTVPEAVREHLRVIQKNAELETRLIDDLLDVTKISKGKLHLDCGIVDASEILRAVIEVCSADIQSKQLLVSVDLDATNHQLHADEDRLRQVFWNLLKNAIKFTPPGGRIGVRSINLQNDLLRVEIQDTGKGLSPQLLSRIFDPFEQGEDSEGLGLGLTISKNIAELHGGHISASSAGLGKGATFVVELPALTA